ncbi:hypothetical protein NPIL_189751 [Nephila pilipes]|uniref:Uncharacterized protein n=1 Tax=Nephila pilipes TaxID=299642 RepID=A0A8X6PPK7_NEPPI|nr:hypothetical protein NPIL_189751 [Nephila pilipes]
MKNDLIFSELIREACSAVSEGFMTENRALFAEIDVFSEKESIEVDLLLGQLVIIYLLYATSWTKSFISSEMSEYKLNNLVPFQSCRFNVILILELLGCYPSPFEASYLDKDKT